MRKEKLTVVLDIDGVMADFELEFCLQFGNKNRHYSDLEKRYPEKRAEIQNFVADRRIYRDLLTIPVGIEIAKWLATQRAVVHIVSARPPNSKEVTRKWLAQYEVPYETLTISRDKGKIIKDLSPDIVVDDIIGVCTFAHLNIPGVTPVLVRQPWNEIIFFPRIARLEQFQRIFNKVADEKLSTDYEGVELA